jgi:hypothetical protein
MFELITHPGDGQTFIVTINGQEKSYTSDKAGKRQAILDGLQAIPPVTAGNDTYLPSNQALQIVAAVMYPAGIQTEEAYEKVSLATGKACALLGYGEEVQLGPPHVPFTARGAYRKRYPEVDRQELLAEMANAPCSHYAPRQEISGRILWNTLAWSLYNRSLSALTPAQQQQIRDQVNTHAAEGGWQMEVTAADTVYSRPLAPDLPAARRLVEQLLVEARGEPVSDYALTAEAQRGAYGRVFYSEALSGDLEALVQECLVTRGYRTQTDGSNLYQPRPLTLSPDGVRLLAEKLAAVTPISTDLSPALLMTDVFAAVRQSLDESGTAMNEEGGETATAGTATATDYQIRKLLTEDAGAAVLRHLGYRAEVEWLQPYQMQPDPGDGRSREVFLREIRIGQGAETLQFVQGMRVHAPAVALDDENDDVVYLEMAGQKAAVRANWAALVGKKAQWIGRQRVYLEGMKKHVQIQTKLPCGWLHTALIHRQASLQEANPEEPFYLLDDGRTPIPPLFYPMLNRCLAVPLLPAWSDYLWERGRKEKLITLLNNGEGQGYAAWRVLPVPVEWEAVISGGLQAKQIVF